MANIFISYRREDTQSIAGRIFEHLGRHYGLESVFIDTDRILAGSDFRDQIHEMLDKCDVLIALVGPRWLMPDSGPVRISNKNDWVRIEIAAALAKKVPLVPLLIDGTKMPHAEDLPEDIRDFVFRAALNLDTGIDFHNHMQRLITSLNRTLANKKSAGLPLLENAKSADPQAATQNNEVTADVGSRTEAQSGASAFPLDSAIGTSGLPSRSEDISKQTSRVRKFRGKKSIVLLFAAVLTSALLLMAYRYGSVDGVLARLRDDSAKSDDSQERIEKPALRYAKQDWTQEDRDFFYTKNQGSRMMPYLWYKALRRLDVDTPFGGDQLQRYGYLPNAKSTLNPEGLPVGFAIDGDDVATGYLGMTCAACHTAEIEYQQDGATRRLRIDGAPTTADFQAFLKDVTAVTRETLSNADRFDKFARAVLGNGYSVAHANELKTKFAAWVKQWGNFMEKSLPASPWGPGRLDAFGMMFNRVAARDLGIEANFKVADAPVSYPFLWNARQQDRTQWNGSVPNGLFINALGRNSGEVLGVFGDFEPKKQTSTHLPVIDYSKNSIKFASLQALEEKIKILKPPPWPWEPELRQDMVDKGRILFATECGRCHDENRGPFGTWKTRVEEVGTDQKMFDNAEKTSQTGILAGALSPNRPGSLDDPAATNDVLATVVAGALINEAFPSAGKFPAPDTGVWQAIRNDLGVTQPDPQDSSAIENLKSRVFATLANLFKVPPGPPHAYESRVLRGIWATAPYLHNGSVPNLWELLTPPAQRKPFFMVGSKKYDRVNVGYVTDESPFKDGKLVVSGSDVQPGNSNTGHEFGTKLSDDEKWQLIEYLKQF